jgi:hypothetical protein
MKIISTLSTIYYSSVPMCMCVCLYFIIEFLNNRRSRQISQGFIILLVSPCRYEKYLGKNP